MKKLIDFFSKNNRPLAFLILGPLLFLFLLLFGTEKEGFIPYIVLFFAWAPTAIVVIYDLILSNATKM